jgi:hypothetical protein
MAAPSRARRSSAAAAPRVAVFAVLALLFGTAAVHGQATGGDIFNVNPGGTPDTRVICPNLPGWVMVPLTEIPRLDYRSCAPCSDGTHAVCDPVPSPHPTAIPHPQSPSTDCPGLLAQARATATAIEGGNTDPTPMNDLTKVLQKCPPAFARPINCFAMMVDAQSKVRTNPDYSRRRAQEALDCYEGNRPSTRQVATPPPNPPTLACPAAQTGSLSSPETDGAEASVVLAQFSDLAAPLDWGQWMNGSPDDTVPGLRDVLFLVWSAKIQEPKYGTTASFDPEVRPLPAPYRNWKFVWSTCPAKVQFTLRCYAKNISAKPISTYCVVLRVPKFAPADWVNASFWIFLRDNVLTSDVIGDSNKIPPWPVSLGNNVRRDPSGRYYVDVDYTFVAIVKPPTHKPRQK